jgi:putative Mn2+ efflux pump MntP
VSFVEVLLLAIGLAMDSFSVSLSASASGHAIDRRSAARLAFHLGFFQFLMPVVGWYLAYSVAHIISSFDHWIAFGLLLFVGARMIWSGLTEDSAVYDTNPSRGFTMVMLSIATSIDALAVGLSLAVLGISIWYPSAVIGIVTAGISLAGVLIGAKLGSFFGKRIGILGGLILLFIGVRILLAHLMA